MIELISFFPQTKAKVVVFVDAMFRFLAVFEKL